jgi:hypothetical protein
MHWYVFHFSFFVGLVWHVLCCGGEGKGKDDKLGKIADYIAL